MKFGMCVCVMLLAGSLSGAEIVITTNSARTNLSPVLSAPRTNAFKGLQVKRGFRVELVAAEPLVVNPGAMAFDENGRLFVVESPEGQPGRIRLLEDTDGDGVFDSSRVYADGVYGATALTCYGGGVFVGAGTEILYLKDTKGDGQADSRRVVFSGFGDATNGASGILNFTAMVWGMDNRIHVATVGHSGDIISSSQPKQSIVLSGGCFSFDPRTFVLMDESGGGASGMGFDNRGHRFISSPTEHLKAVMYESRYAARNPFWQMPEAMVDIGAPDVIYPAAVATPLPVRFFAATGLTFYRGYLFPPEYVDNAFVADTSANVVHRDKLRRNGFALFAERAQDEMRSEFLTVSDNSFQPTTFANGPEGALYVAGPAREGAVFTPGKDGKANAPAGRGFGRIYRIVPISFKQPALTQFGSASVTNLVNALRHSNAWNRDSAARLLYERQDKTAVYPVIQLLYDPRSPPLARVYALHALDGLQTLVPGHIVRALSDADDRVREHAVLLSERLLTNGMMMPGLIWGPLAGLHGDPSPLLRYQLAFTLGQCRNPDRAQALADTLRSDAGNRWLQAAVLSSLNEGAGDALRILAGDGDFRASVAGQEFLGRVAMMIGAKNQPDEVAQAMRDIAAIPEGEPAFQTARRLGDGLQMAKSSLAMADPQGILKPLYAGAARVATDMNAVEGARVQAIRLLDPTAGLDGQTSVVLSKQWFGLTPRVQNELLNAWCSRPELMAFLMSNLELGTIPRPRISLFQTKFLLSQPDNAVRERARIIYGTPAVPSRQNVVGQFAAAAQMAGASDRGRAVFVARCGDCHRVGNDGDPLGMILKPVMGVGKDAVLAKILDPNRNVATDNSAVIVNTTDRQTLGGGVIAQNANAITLCQPNGEIRTVARQNVVSEITLGISAMPEGLEAGLSQQDLSDLLEFLCPGLP